MTKRLAILLGGTALALALTAAPVHLNPTTLSINSSNAWATGDPTNPPPDCRKNPNANINSCYNAGEGNGTEGGDPGNSCNNPNRQDKDDDC